MFACEAVCPLLYRKNHMSELHQFLCMLPVAMAFVPPLATECTVCISGVVDDVNLWHMMPRHIGDENRAYT